MSVMNEGGYIENSRSIIIYILFSFNFLCYCSWFKLYSAKRCYYAFANEYGIDNYFIFRSCFYYSYKEIKILTLYMVQVMRIGLMQSGWRFYDSTTPAYSVTIDGSMYKGKKYFI